ncbi:MAG TPA: hypothetical protein PK957_01425 [Candidatus Dojkabacteria bacterium]|nr:hypothetical protein [Candidatus Dojkabacteria bacterium]HQF36448.1 hypothetical protein [Candidatus Dojkabacteria bacterium]
MNIIIPTGTMTGLETGSLFYRGQDLPKEVTRSILAYPCMDLL